MKLKGLKITRSHKGGYTVTPLFYSKRGGTRSATHLMKKGYKITEVVAEVVKALVARGDVGG